MITRRTLFMAGAALTMSGLPIAQAAQSASNQGDFLFVQSAKSFSFDGSVSALTLNGVSPITFFFSDRPQRIAGNMTTAAFIPFWSKGKDSFLSDPPNADVSILAGGKLQQVIVELRDPVLHTDSLTYTIRELEGKLATRGTDVSLFIDIIGMPLTPVSYAGVGRRTFRRAVIY